MKDESKLVIKNDKLVDQRSRIERLKVAPDIYSLRELWCAEHCKYAQYSEVMDTYRCSNRSSAYMLCGGIVICPIKKGQKDRPIN